MVIILELTLSVGWNSITGKIEGFLKKQGPPARPIPRRIDKNLPYSKAFKSFDWTSRK